MAEPSHPSPVDPAELGFETIVYEKAPPRATIRLNRPDVLNAFDFRMLREIARACEDASWDDDVRVVVVTGEGRAFCVGADLRTWEDTLVGRPQEYWKWFGAFKDMHDRMRELGKPTIARVNGIAVGGGNELQMACDLAVMVDDAFIRHVGLEHGSVPAGGATQWLQLMVRPSRARDRLPVRGDPGAAGGRVGADQPRRPRSRARRGRRRLGREPRAQAAADDALREAAAERLARHGLAPDDRPRARLALALDARRRGPGRDPGVPGLAAREGSGARLKPRRGVRRV
jgi:enoyl-CoA hydratase/carnithine racemase